MRALIIFFVTCLICFNTLATVKTNLSHPAQSLIFDFPEIQVATAEYPEGPTGTTLFYFPKGAQAAVDIRGGSVGTFFTQEKMQQGEAYIDGITFNGGGILGLEANAGVIASHFHRPSQSSNFNQMPLFSGAVIYDFNPRKGSKIYPDKALGQAAYKALESNHFPLGRRGAGVSATAGKLFGLQNFAYSGQGAAFAQVGDLKIAVFTVVNAVGMILDENNKVIVGPPDTLGHSLNEIQPRVEQAILQAKESPQPGNTTLTLVVTNRKMSPRHLQQLGRQVHTSMAQVIYPFHALLDGDVLYTVSTQTSGEDANSHEIIHDMTSDNIYIGYLASQLVKQAVWSAVGYSPQS